MKKHPMFGAKILQHITEIPGLAVGARWHHERYDGSGYPDGLAGPAIPEEARIIAVADAYDAMSSQRNYSGVMKQKKVRDEIERGKGTQFDPEIADILLAMIDEDTNYHMNSEVPVYIIREHFGMFD
jgi:putative two-component system response regulator